MLRGFLIISALLVSSTAVPAGTFHVDDLGDNVRGDGSVTKPFRNLQAALDRCSHGDTVIIGPGKYVSQSYAYPESLCGNCEDHVTPVKASRGFLVENKGLTIIGSGVDSTVLVTGAGYGVLFLRSYGSYISNLQITGGKRDLDGMATDAAVVVKWGRVTIENCLIADNSDRPESVVVGIGGIMGREGAELFIINNRIKNNTWDGIALYRGATAYIADNIINGGRGAGIGITWDANAVIVRNRISNYWKGIGSFGDSRVVCSNNIVRDNLGWGIIATGTSYMDATNNIVYNNGNCGMAIWSDECTGRFSNNIVVNNGWRDQWVCPCVGIWNYGTLYNFDISYNDVWSNKDGEYGDMPDYTDKKGNISVDPGFADTEDFRLLPDSPLKETGNPLLTDSDGTRSDIGLYGGPKARQKESASGTK
ncbi:MAG: right-handed parallel beta-helix repeat-containing protein [Candidatus Zixiibacteriota bacterium]|nr:MAG: right-handed parallel beta-helix repeat-containing protein [candidate division Zixibacteria bacterium]